MTHSPDFSIESWDLRDRFVETLVTIVMALLAADGWFAYIGR
jgi:hypothetical protein